MTEETVEFSNNVENNEKQSGVPVRLGCGFIILSTILCSAFVFALVSLMVEGEINIKRGELGGYRLWLLQENGIKGLRFSSSKEVNLGTGTGETCIETKVRFFEWAAKADGIDTQYCECFQSHEGEWIYIGECPP